MRIEDGAMRMIDYRLNILGIRVWEHSCQLIAKSGDKWSMIGPQVPLPVHIPQTAAELKAVTCPLRLTAYQYQAERPGSDLAAVLSDARNFGAAFHSHALIQKYARLYELSLAQSKS